MTMENGGGDETTLADRAAFKQQAKGRLGAFVSVKKLYERSSYWVVKERHPAQSGQVR